METIYRIKSDAEILRELRHRHKDALGEAEVHFKRGTIPDPEVDVQRREVRGIVSTTAIDNDNEVVVPSGMDCTYFPDSVKTVYLSHDYTKPVGKCTRLWLAKGGKAMYATTYLSQTPLGEDTLTMMNEGVIEGFSITFIPQDFGAPTQKEMAEYGKGKDFRSIVRKGKLIEFSITPMPCNPEAKMSRIEKALSQGLIRRDSAVAFGLPESPKRKQWRATPIVCDDGRIIYAGRRG